MTDDLAVKRAAAERPFTVRAWPMGAAEPPVDLSHWSYLDMGLSEAISVAKGRFHGQRYRQVALTDPWANTWATFGMLWQAEEAKAQ